MGDSLPDYVILDSAEDEKGNNKDIGRCFLFLGYSDGASYPLERFQYSEEKRKEVIKSAEEIARLKNGLLTKKKN